MPATEPDVTFDIDQITVTSTGPFLDAADKAGEDEARDMLPDNAEIYRTFHHVHGGPPHTVEQTWRNRDAHVGTEEV